jgi:para-nitrobenzyl esterase|tara:strand:+ start:639 stop:2222 length:1584 start_codon:yes stop_codon:yes gene_type:complete
LILLTVLACSPAPEAPAPKSPRPEAPIARTTMGSVRGFIENDILVFKGVRYGKDTATTRFAAPQSPEPWSDVTDALEFGASAVQIPYPEGTAGGLFESWATVPKPDLSEDCLFLNVWTPALSDDGKRPVMVWFHGGGLTRGSGSSNAYDGVRLANRGDVVVVTVNHRLNVFGYTYLGEYGARFADSGNAGILDMVLALEWVRDNIAEFGGDPGNVTIFGESGGGVKVSALMAMEAASGLVHKAVVQSGPGLEFIEKQEAAEGAAALLATLSLTADTVDQLLTLPAAEILTAYEQVNAAGIRLGVRAVLDDKHFARHPFVPDATPRAADIPMMIGTTRTETSLFIGARNPATFELDWERLPSAMTASLGRKDVDVGEVIAGYRRIRPEYSPADLLFTAATDAGFLNRSHQLADRKAEQGGAPAFFYMLNWDTPVDGGKWRAPHALEIGMVFDNVAKSASMSGVGEDQQRIADLMSEAWLAFARTGDPNNALLPDWPAYTTEDRMVMLFDLEPQAQSDPHGEQRRLFLE